jgi:AcrR family transcriptional regulator
MYKIQKNPSAIRSQIKIAHSLLNLLKDGHSYKEISISDISAKANMVRKTFYSNFRSKEDIVKYIIDNTIELFLKNTNIETSEQYEIFSKLFAFLFQRKEFLLQVNKNGLYDMIGKMTTDYLLKNKLYLRYQRFSLSKEKSWYYNYLPEQLTVTVLLIVKNWVLGNFNESPEQLGKLAEDLIQGNLWKK